MMSRHAGKYVVIASVLSALGIAGACTGISNIGENGGRDGWLPDAAEGQCGDGLDSDGDGFVDDGCPCTPGQTVACFPGPVSARDRGACSDGLMMCPGRGELSLWSGTCSGAVVPDDEACNGIDDDCDGAVDEGCGCQQPGESRLCGDAVKLGPPCGPGQQTCEANGIWSDCEGAVLPELEACRDGIDNDCDGQADEGCETDGGMGGAGGTGPTDEVCDNGTDDDLNGFIDDGCDTHCPCAPTDIVWNRVQSPDGLTIGSWEAARSAYAGTQHLIAYVGSEQAYSDASRTYSLYLARYDAAGAHLGTTRIADAPSTFASTDGLVWTGKEAVVLANDVLVRADADGDPIGAPTPSPYGNSIAWNGRQIGRLSYDTGKLLFDLLDTNLGVVAGPVEIAASGSIPNLAWTGTRWVVVFHDEPSHALFLDGATVVRDYELSALEMASPFVAASNHGALVCGHYRLPGYSDTTPVTCQLYSGDGSEVGSPIVIDQGPFRMGGCGAFWWQCGYTVILPSGTSEDSTRIVRILDDRSVQDVPLPEPGAGYSWFFHSDFDDIEYAPDHVMFETRWFSPYMKSGRMRVSCEP